VVQVTLQSREVCEVEFPCDDSAASLTISASGKLIADVQASQDGMTWPSPCASARLDSEERTIPLMLPQGTRKLRVLLQNSTHGPVSVEISDPVSAVASDAG
jgi:hypothetical protein